MFCVFTPRAQAEEPPGFAVVTGRTLSVTRGIPGGLSGNPEPNWKPPEPEVAPGEKIFWLRIDRKNGHQLFATVSDGKGEYRIELPPGRYLAEPASMHGWELRRFGESDTRKLIRLVFRSYRKGENGPEVFYGEPGMELRSGEEYREDIDAQILFVD
jgi:hypothetical protein